MKTGLRVRSRLLVGKVLAPHDARPEMVPLTE